MNLPRRVAVDAAPRRRFAARISAIAAGALVAGALIPLAFSGAAAASTPHGGDVIANLFEWNWNSVGVRVHQRARARRLRRRAGRAARGVGPRWHSPTHPWWEVYQPVSYQI